ncbi:Uncharacterized protein Adt_19628 [Abeliophyllum distichum]|uniref:Retrotransposon gag domain-containing protein n=1 Tax=Abeliophyllum distichum TaxID=126358 RepID=A0ABD1SVH7_9LAMI
MVGACNTEEVENLLFDMKQYFLAANIEDEARRIMTTTMYLGGDAKLWLRTKYADIQANRITIRVATETKERLQKKKSSTAPRKDVCFLCGGPHRVKDCPQKQFVNALSQLISRTLGSKQHVSQASSHCEADYEEDEDVIGVFSHRCNTISHQMMEKGKINGKSIKAMVDTGATHNYNASPEVECLGLVLEKGSGKDKAINSDVTNCKSSQVHAY